MRCGSTFASAKQGHLYPPLLGRLAHMLHDLQAGHPQHNMSFDPCDPAGSYCEFRKEPFNSQPASHVHRGHPRLGSDEGLSLPTEGGRHPQPCLTCSKRYKVDIWSISQATGEIDSRIDGRASGTPLTAPFAGLGQWSGPQPQEAPRQDGDGLRQVSPVSRTLEKQSLSLQRCSLGLSSFPLGDSGNRCLPLGLGRCVEPQDSQGNLGSSAEAPAYKRIGATCSTLGPQALSSLFGREACTCSVRQHLDSLSCEPPRRNQVQSFPTGGSEAPSMGLTSPCKSQGNAFARCAEHGGRHAFSPEAPSWGVEAEPYSGSSDGVGEVRHSGCRPICLKGVNALPAVVFALGTNQPTGAGRPGTPLAGPSSVCLSSDTTTHADTSQDRQVQSLGVASCSLLAWEDMVSSLPLPSQRSALGPPTEAGSPFAVGGEHLASSSGVPPVACLAPEGLDSLLNLCDQAVVQTIISARASSTRLLYANRWKLFSVWCGSQNVDPEHCSVPVLLKYLQTLLDKGLSASTIKLYVAAISARHAFVDGRSVGSHALVGRFLKGALRLRPPHTVRVPSWDLPVVLEALCSPPFEPLEHADLKWLSCKTAFLLAVTSAKWVGELHALSVASECLRWNPDGLGPNPSFLPKRLLAAFAPESGVEELPPNAAFLCPVRALKQYIEVSAGFRKSDALFVCYGGHRKGCALSKQRLSHWVVDTISHAYRLKGLQIPPVKCHSTRSVSTLWAALKGVPLDDICAAAAWASSCTFARFYRVNVAIVHPVSCLLLRSETGSW